MPVNMDSSMRPADLPKSEGMGKTNPNSRVNMPGVQPSKAELAGMCVGIMAATLLMLATPPSSPTMAGHEGQPLPPDPSGALGSCAASCTKLFLESKTGQKLFGPSPTKEKSTPQKSQQAEKKSAAPATKPSEKMAKSEKAATTKQAESVKSEPPTKEKIAAPGSAATKTPERAPDSQPLTRTGSYESANKDFKTAAQEQHAEAPAAGGGLSVASHGVVRQTRSEAKQEATPFAPGGIVNDGAKTVVDNADVDGALNIGYADEEGPPVPPRDDEGAVTQTVAQKQEAPPLPPRDHPEYVATKTALPQPAVESEEKVETAPFAPGEIVDDEAKIFDDKGALEDAFGEAFAQVKEQNATLHTGTKEVEEEGPPIPARDYGEYAAKAAAEEKAAPFAPGEVVEDEAKIFDDKGALEDAFGDAFAQVNEQNATSQASTKPMEEEGPPIPARDYGEYAAKAAAPPAPAAPTAPTAPTMKASAAAGTISPDQLTGVNLRKTEAPDAKPVPQQNADLAAITGRRASIEGEPAVVEEEEEEDDLFKVDLAPSSTTTTTQSAPTAAEVKPTQKPVGTGKSFKMPSPASSGPAPSLEEQLAKAAKAREERVEKGETKKTESAPAEETKETLTDVLSKRIKQEEEEVKQDEDNDAEWQ